MGLNLYCVNWNEIDSSSICNLVILVTDRTQLSLKVMNQLIPTTNFKCIPNEIPIAMDILRVMSWKRLSNGFDLGVNFKCIPFWHLIVLVSLLVLLHEMSLSYHKSRYP